MRHSASMILINDRGLCQIYKPWFEIFDQSFPLNKMWAGYIKPGVKYLIKHFPLAKMRARLYIDFHIILLAKSLNLAYLPVHQVLVS